MSDMLGLNKLAFFFFRYRTGLACGSLSRVGGVLRPALLHSSTQCLLAGSEGPSILVLAISALARPFLARVVRKKEKEIERRRRKAEGQRKGGGGREWKRESIRKDPCSRITPHAEGPRVLG